MPDLAPADDAQHPARALLSFNQQVLDQAMTLLSHFGGSGLAAPAPLAGPVGAHLRHIIEHYDALVFPACASVVDYDGRIRERALESDPKLAAARLLALRDRLSTWPASMLDMAVQVRGQAGLNGQWRFEVGSTIGRELAFVASHAIHHFAVLAAQGQTPDPMRHVTLPAHFGKAPATVAHERALAAAAVPTHLNPLKETPCPATPLAA